MAVQKVRLQVSQVITNCVVTWLLITFFFISFFTAFEILMIRLFSHEAYIGDAHRFSGSKISTLSLIISYKSSLKLNGLFVDKNATRHKFFTFIENFNGFIGNFPRYWMFCGKAMVLHRKVETTLCVQRSYFFFSERFHTEKKILQIVQS